MYQSIPVYKIKLVSIERPFRIFRFFYLNKFYTLKFGIQLLIRHLFIQNVKIVFLDAIHLSYFYWKFSALTFELLEDDYLRQISLF